MFGVDDVRRHVLRPGPGNADRRPFENEPEKRLLPPPLILRSL